VEGKDIQLNLYGFLIVSVYAPLSISFTLAFPFRFPSPVFFFFFFFSLPSAGVAANTAYKKVKEHGNLKAFLDSIEDKDRIPKEVDYDDVSILTLNDTAAFFIFSPTTPSLSLCHCLQVKSLFLKPEVIDPATIELKWGDPDKDGLMKFLVEEKGFNVQRVEGGIAKLQKARSSGQQLRMDSFFKVAPSSSSASSGPAAAGAGTKKGSQVGVGTKRKGDGKEKDADKKKK
jgi:hypothetical protein